MDKNRFSPKFGIYYTFMLGWVSDEVKIMCSIAAQDIRSVTAKNCYNLTEEFSLDPWTVPICRFNEEYKYYVLPDQDKWRLSYLMDLLVQKYEMDACGEDTDIVTELIQSLCSS